MLSLLLIAVVIGGSQASLSADQFMDNVLYTKLQNVLRNERLDPTFLPDYSFDYYDKTFIGKVHGKAEYTKGSLTGLAKVARQSSCQGPLNYSGLTTINCMLSFNSLETSYKGKVKYGKLPKVSIDAKGNTSITVEVEITKASNEVRGRVKALTIRSASRLDTKFTGLGPLNKHMKVLEENYKNQVSQEVVQVILNRFQYALNLAVGEVPVPVQ